MSTPTLITPTDASLPHTFIPYGTAGFRMVATNPNLAIATRKVVLYLVNKASEVELASGEASILRFGIMITASHNAIQDNGLKVMDHRGEMYPYEAELQEFVNDNDMTLAHMTRALQERRQRDENFNVGTAELVIGWDTRPTCAHFVKIIRDAVSDLRQVGYGVRLHEFGVCTTPELHWSVREWAYVQAQAPREWTKVYRYEMAQRVKRFVRVILEKNRGVNEEESAPSKLKWFQGEFDLAVDTAYGCGGITLAEILSQCSDVLESTPKMVNLHQSDDDSQYLNLRCGAEYVQKDQKFPVDSPQEGTVYASFDGDADRLVFSYSPDASTKAFRLIDGDKIAILFALFVNEQLTLLKLKDEVTVGVVQTAYANGSSTRFLQQNVFGADDADKSVACVATGVKHLHAKAHDYDVGIYFEANGHGTVLFSKKMHERLALFDENEPLKLFADLINQAVGDAISDMFGALCVLAYRGMTVDEWSSLYTDFPSLTTKLEVPDRSLIKTTPDERRIVSPEVLQQRIDDYIKELGLEVARTFVRPSGTEDVVRIYAESHDTDHVVKIEASIREIVSNHFAPTSDLKRKRDDNDTGDKDSKKAKTE